MKRSIPVLAVLVACLACVPAVLAQSLPRCCPVPGGPPDHVSMFCVSGSVTAVDTSADALSVAVDHGSRGLSGTVSVNVTSDTKLFSLGDQQKAVITLADVAAGDHVMVFGTVDASSGTPVYTASLVCARVPPVPRFACVGSVTATDTNAGTLTMTVDHGSGGLSGPLIAKITSDTKLFSLGGFEKTPITLGDIKVGDQVAIRGTIDASSGTPVYTATVVCVRGPRGLSFACVGSVTQTDTSADALTVAVDHGTAQLSDTLTANITSDTALYLLGDQQKTAITMADIHVGDQVAMVGTVDTSSGTAVYTAGIVLDWGAAASLPQPLCKPAALKVAASHAGRGDTLKIPVKVADTMPGTGTAKVALTVTTLNGRKLASTTVSGVSLNKAAKLSWKLTKPLPKGTYRIVARAIDWAGNKQAKPTTATLKVT